MGCNATNKVDVCCRNDYYRGMIKRMGNNQNIYAVYAIINKTVNKNIKQYNPMVQIKNISLYV